MNDRDTIAMHVLQGYVSHHGWHPTFSVEGRLVMHSLPEAAYALADALLHERDKVKNG